MKRWLAPIALLPLFSGCLYYAYPTISHTPELAVPNADGSVHAYRVDIDRTERKPLAPATQYTLTEIRLDARGLIPSQLEIAPTTGLLNPIGVVDGGQHEKTNYTMFVRAYRPGYRTVEVKSWEKSRELQWIIAADLAGQEAAIDALLADPAAPTKQMNVGGISATLSPEELYRLTTTTWWELKDQKSPPLGLQPGLVSPSQRQTLLFAASEYERLALSPAAGTPSMQTTRVRLQQKAAWLRSYAERGPLP